MKHFAGRQAELDKFQQLIKQGQSSRWLIEGRGGIGKTTLLNQCAKLCAEQQYPHSRLYVQDLVALRSGLELLNELIEHSEFIKTFARCADRR